LENKRAEPVLGWVGAAEVAKTMYTHVSKCKNDKINIRKISKTKASDT
jgi:hypothetical protein